MPMVTVGATGVVLRLTAKDDENEIVPLNSATAIRLVARSHALRRELEWRFVTDGKDGQLQAAVPSAMFDEPLPVRWQLVATFSPASKHFSQKGTIDVDSPL